jgi:hypothetical protein
MLDPHKTAEREAKRLGFGDWNTIDTMLREVVVTLKEEQACLELWFKDESVDEDVQRGIEISLTKISEALGKLAALEK